MIADNIYDIRASVLQQKFADHEGPIYPVCKLLNKVCFTCVVAYMMFYCDAQNVVKIGRSVHEYMVLIQASR